MIKGMAKLSPQIANANPGFAIQRAGTGIGFLTDEALMKAAMRRGFKVGAAHAFASSRRPARQGGVELALRGGPARACAQGKGGAPTALERSRT